MVINRDNKASLNQYQDAYIPHNVYIVNIICHVYYALSRCRKIESCMAFV